jgi:hypothetical protein
MQSSAFSGGLELGKNTGAQEKSPSEGSIELLIGGEGDVQNHFLFMSQTSQYQFKKARQAARILESIKISIRFSSH